MTFLEAIGRHSRKGSAVAARQMTLAMWLDAFAGGDAQIDMGLVLQAILFGALSQTSDLERLSAFATQAMAELEEGTSETQETDRQACLIAAASHPSFNGEGLTDAEKAWMDADENQPTIMAHRLITRIDYLLSMRLPATEEGEQEIQTVLDEIAEMSGKLQGPAEQMSPELLAQIKQIAQDDLMNAHCGT